MLTTPAKPFAETTIGAVAVATLEDRVNPEDVEDNAMASPPPLKGTDCGELAALSTIVIPPARAPAVIGVNVTESVQLEPASRVALQVLV